MTRLLPALLLPALLLPGLLGAEDIELLEPSLVRQLETMERAVDRHFRSVAGSQLAGVIGSTRSIYLKGYGAVFSIEVNLAPTANVSPFRRSYTAEEIRALNSRKRASLGPLCRKMREILLAEGAALTGLAPDLQVTLAVSLFHFPWEDRTQLPSQIVIGAARGRLTGETSLITRYY